MNFFRRLFPTKDELNVPALKAQIENLRWELRDAMEKNYRLEREALEAAAELIDASERANEAVLALRLYRDGDTENKAMARARMVSAKAEQYLEQMMDKGMWTPVFVLKDVGGSTMSEPRLLWSGEHHPVTLAEWVLWALTGKDEPRTSLE